MPSPGSGSSIWNQLQKVRVTNGKIEAPVRANGKDGIQVGDPGVVGSAKAADAPADPPRGIRRRLASLFR